MTDKPKFPEVAPTMELAVEAKLALDFSKYSSGKLSMRFADTTVHVSDDAGNKIGLIAACIGGGVDLERNGVVWHISSQSLWDAFNEALEKQEVRS